MFSCDDVVALLLGFSRLNEENSSSLGRSFEGTASIEVLEQLDDIYFKVWGVDL